MDQQPMTGYYLKKCFMSFNDKEMYHWVNKNQPERGNKQMNNSNNI